MSKQMKTAVLIPARMESSRFPGKPLANILGKPMIQWVYEAVEKCAADDVFIISDNKEILDVVAAFDGSSVKTSAIPKNGTERCLEAIEILQAQDLEYDVIINVQGDEPLIDYRDIDKLIALMEDGDVDVATLIAPIQDESEWKNPNVVKAVTTLFEDDYCDVNYFSRAPIPFAEKFEVGQFFKHIGVYAFTNVALEEIKLMPPSPLESFERLEQLRWLQNHMLISGVITENQMVGVDTEVDLQIVEKILKSKS